MFYLMAKRPNRAKGANTLPFCENTEQIVLDEVQKSDWKGFWNLLGVNLKNLKELKKKFLEKSFSNQ